MLFSFFCFRFRIVSFVKGVNDDILREIPYKFSETKERSQISDFLIYSTPQSKVKNIDLLCLNLKTDGKAYVYEKEANLPKIYSLENHFPGQEEVIESILNDGGEIVHNDSNTKYIITDQKTDLKLVKKFTNLTTKQYIYGNRKAAKYLLCSKALIRPAFPINNLAKSILAIFILVFTARIITELLYTIQEENLKADISKEDKINDLIKKYYKVNELNTVMTCPITNGNVTASYSDKISTETVIDEGKVTLTALDNNFIKNNIISLIEEQFIHMINSADFNNLSEKIHRESFSTLAKIFLVKSAYFYQIIDGKYIKICEETFGGEEIDTSIFEEYRNKNVSSFKHKGKDYIIFFMPLKSSEYVIVVEKHDLDAQFEEYNFLFRFILFLILWNEELSQKVCEKILLNYQDIIEASKSLVVVEFNCSMHKVMYQSSKGIKCLETNEEFVEKAKIVARDGKPFSRETFHCIDENNQKKVLSVSGYRKYDDMVESNVLLFIIEDITKFYSIDTMINDEKFDFMLATNVFGLHHYKIKDGKFTSDTFFKELNSNEDTSKVISVENIKAIERLKPSEKLPVHINNSKNESSYYQAICTGEQTGFLISINEKTELNENLRVTQSMLLFGEKENIFKCRVLSFDDNDDDSYCGVIPIVKYEMFQKMLHPEDRERFTRTSLKQITNEYRTKFKYFIQSLNAYFSYQVTFQPMQENRMLVFAINDQENKTRMSLLNSANRLIKLALDYSDVHFWHFNPDSEIIYIDQPELNRSVEIGWNTILYNVFNEYQAETEAAFREALTTSNGINKEVLMMLDKPRWLLFRGIKSGPDKELSGIYIDLTELKEAESITKQSKESLVEAAKTKVEFLKRMSTQVRHPTNEICSLLELLKTSHLKKEQEELVNVIHVSLLDLLEMLNNTIDLSKIEMNEDTVVLENFSPFDLLSEVVLKYFRLGKKKGVKFYFETSPTTPIELHGDSKALLRTSQILLGSSFKKTEGGTLYFYIDYIDGYLKVDVCNASGSQTINEAERVIVQHRFDEPDSFSLSIDGIVGINYALISYLIKRAGGTISISTIPNVSTTVTFKIPYKTVRVAKRRENNNGTVAYLNRKEYLSGSSVKFFEHYGFEVTSLTYEELLGEHIPIKALFCNIYLDKNFEDLVSLQQQNKLEGVRVCIINEDEQDTSKLKPPIDLLRNPPDYTQIHLLMNELSEGRDFDTSSTKNIKPQKIDLKVLIVEEPNFMHYASDKLIEMLGCTIKIMHREEKIICDGFDVIVMWVEDSGKTDLMINCMKSIRKTSKTIPILCVTLSSQYTVTTKCLNAGASLVINAPVTTNSLFDAFVKLHQ